ncbi:MAG TPA: hypothetical protein VEK15_20480 [Vicinamibacteria bacterium]|nr:hypothetical protein [Vicinamibacteria bacterium]
MTKTTSVLILAIVLFGIGLAETSILADGPTLKVKSPRMTFMRPRMPNEPQRPAVTIRVTAELEDLDKAEDPEKYYCLAEVWEWDDDTESEYAPDCDPYTEGVELKRHFSASHQYRYPGTYTVYLRLERNGKTVIAGNAKVQIRS